MRERRKCLRATHQTLVPILQGTHHSCFVLLLDLLAALGFLHCLQFLLVEGELDGVGSWLCPKVVHTSLKPL